MRRDLHVFLDLRAVDCLAVAVSFNWMRRLSWSHELVEAGRNLWTLSSLTSPCSEQGYLQKAPQAMSNQVLNISSGVETESLWAIYHTGGSIFLSSNGLFCISGCAHCFLSFPQAPLGYVWHVRYWFCGTKGIQFSIFHLPKIIFHGFPSQKCWTCFLHLYPCCCSCSAYCKRKK